MTIPTDEELEEMEAKWTPFELPRIERFPGEYLWLGELDCDCFKPFMKISVGDLTRLAQNNAAHTRLIEAVRELKKKLAEVQPYFDGTHALLPIGGVHRYE